MIAADKGHEFPEAMTSYWRANATFPRGNEVRPHPNPLPRGEGTGRACVQQVQAGAWSDIVQPAAGLTPVRLRVACRSGLAP